MSFENWERFLAETIERLNNDSGNAEAKPRQKRRQTKPRTNNTIEDSRAGNPGMPTGYPSTQSSAAQSEK